MRTCFVSGVLAQMLTAPPGKLQALMSDRITTTLIRIEGEAPFTFMQLRVPEQPHLADAAARAAVTKGIEPRCRGQHSAP